MEDQLPFLLLIAIVTLAAVISGLVMVWLKQPPMVGYILAGLVLGPAGVGFMPHVDAVPLIAEFGVLFLLFFIGMEISLKAFIANLRPAVLTVIGQLVVALMAMMLFGALLDWRFEQVVLLAFVVTMSSTAVALKLLDDIGELRSDLGRIVVAVMIAQDIAIVPMRANEYDAELAALAEHGDPSAYDLPRPMLRKPGYDFSFSGLKTAVMLKVREAQAIDGGIDDAKRADIASSFQEAVVDSLVGKALRAVRDSGRERLVVAGGVGANRRLRERLRVGMTEAGGRVYYPRIEFCTDNGAMIAYTGWLRLRADGATNDATVHARARWDLQEI